MRLVVRGIVENEVGGLLRFSEQMYGKDSYQSSRRYFDWLYADNPHTRGADDCLVALDRGTIVGCIHRMRLPCIGPGGKSTLASLQNHVIAPTLRGGAGIMLLQRAVRGENFTFSPGVGGRLSDAYRRLGYTETPSYWFMHWINPIMAVLERVARGITGGSWPRNYLRQARLQSPRLSRRGLRLTHEPDDRQLRRLADDLARQAGTQVGGHVPWDPALLRWRYFCPAGPRHLLLERPASGSWAVVSHGIRAGITVMRLIEYETAKYDHFLDEVLNVGRELGASLATRYTLRETDRDRLLADGWWLRTDAPSSFRNDGAALALTGGATDVGFEALLTDVVP